ncbi:hypothetical protein OG558_09690 [Kribbella sp. NBC_01510]
MNRAYCGWPAGSTLSIFGDTAGEIAVAGFALVREPVGVVERRTVT